VSVVIPVFDRREVILAAVDSVAAQTFDDHEVIVVDDGSTDGTADVVQAQRPRVQVLRLPENRGPAAARNAGTAAALGDLVMLLDSDDTLVPEALARHVAALDDSPRAVLSCSRLRHEGARKTLLPDEPPPEELGALLVQLLEGRFPALLSSTVFRRAALEAVGGSDERLRTSEDTDLLLRVAPLGRFVFLPERLTLRRLLPDSRSLHIPPDDSAWRSVLDKVLASPHGDLVRPHLRSIRAARSARLFDGHATQGRWREALAQLRRTLSLEPAAIWRLRHVRRRLPRYARRAVRAGLRRLLGHKPS
jgi:glycosyltransferase involved in cell wall biosynthesis